MRFPLGLREKMMRDGGMEPGAMGGPGGMRGRGGRGGRGSRGGPGQADPANPEQLQAFAERALEDGQMELLLGDEDEGRHMGFAEPNVVEVRMGFHNGRLVYEARVSHGLLNPLRQGILRERGEGARKGGAATSPSG